MKQNVAPALVIKKLIPGFLMAIFCWQQSYAADGAVRLSNLNIALPVVESTVAKPVPEGADSAQTSLVPAHRNQHVALGKESASPDARHVADWVIDSGDNLNMPSSSLTKPMLKYLPSPPPGS